MLMYIYRNLVDTLQFNSSNNITTSSSGSIVDNVVCADEAHMTRTHLCDIKEYDHREAIDASGKVHEWLVSSITDYIHI